MLTVYRGHILGIVLIVSLIDVAPPPPSHFQIAYTAVFSKLNISTDIRNTTMS